MSSLFKNHSREFINIGSMDLNELHNYNKNLFDEKEVDRCQEAAFLNNDKNQTAKLISSALKDIIKAKKKAAKK